MGASGEGAVAVPVPERVTASHTQAHHHHAPASLAKLAFGALGIVYGDIGTSPLYAVKECVTLPHGVGATAPNVLGLTSLIFWSLTFVVTMKYLVLRHARRQRGARAACSRSWPSWRGARTRRAIGGRRGSSCWVPSARRSCT